MKKASSSSLTYQTQTVHSILLKKGCCSSKTEYSFQIFLTGAQLSFLSTTTLDQQGTQAQNQPSPAWQLPFYGQEHTVMSKNRSNIVLCVSKQVSANKKTRVITTIGDTTTSMGGLINGFYHTLTKIIRPHNCVSYL